MSMRMAPPGRTSTWQTGLVNPRGPHHCSKCFGSIHAFQTSLRGASNVRIRMSSCFGDFAAGLFFVLVLICLLPFLQFFEVVVQAVETFIPKILKTLRPFVNRLQP